MTPEPSWRTCRICEKAIAHSQSYFRCSDPSCNSEPEPLVFCSTACWEAHQATAQHPGASAQPAVAPPAGASAVDDDKPASDGDGDGGGGGGEVLVVASRLKQYIRQRSGMSTSDRVLSALSHHLRQLADRAVASATKDKRKTVLERDVRPFTEPKAGAPAAPAEPAEEESADTLVVISKFKKYIKTTSGMNTSDAVVPILSAHVRRVARDAIRTAGEDGRKTVLERDVTGAVAD